jgi:hypothetical protein
MIFAKKKNLGVRHVFRNRFVLSHGILLPEQLPGSGNYSFFVSMHELETKYLHFVCFTVLCHVPFDAFGPCRIPMQAILQDMGLLALRNYRYLQ